MIVFAGILLLLFWTGRQYSISVVSAASDAIVVNLAPAPIAPAAPPVEVAPGPARHEQQPSDISAKPSVRETPDHRSATDAVVPVTGAAPSAPVGAPPPAAAAPASAMRIDQTTAPPSEAKPAMAAAAPVTSASTAAAALTNWQGELLGHLKRFRRYPRQAESAGQEGIAIVSITIDRTGQVLGVKLVHGSGYPLLDTEAQATARRASPVPPPGRDIVGDPVTVQVPIQFSIAG